MPRSPRINLSGQIFHIINRSNARTVLFKNKKDFTLFQNVLDEAVQRFEIKLFAFCIMPNHFHFTLSPTVDGEVSKFMHWLTMTFTQRWHTRNMTVGNGHLFQGRYKAFVVENDFYLNKLIIYIEQNPLRAGLIKYSQDWLWSSLAVRLPKNDYRKKILSALPLQLPENYLALVNQLNKEEMKKIRLAITKSIPFGSDTWQKSIIEKFKLHSASRSVGRPKNRS